MAKVFLNYYYYRTRTIKGSLHRKLLNHYLILNLLNFVKNIYRVQKLEVKQFSLKVVGCQSDLTIVIKNSLFCDSLACAAGSLCVYLLINCRFHFQLNIQ